MEESHAHKVSNSILNHLAIVRKHARNGGLVFCTAFSSSANGLYSMDTFLIYLIGKVWFSVALQIRMANRGFQISPGEQESMFAGLAPMANQVFALQPGRKQSTRRPEKKAPELLNGFG